MMSEYAMRVLGIVLLRRTLSFILLSFSFSCCFLDVLSTIECSLAYTYACILPNIYPTPTHSPAVLLLRGRRSRGVVWWMLRSRYWLKDARLSLTSPLRQISLAAVLPTAGSVQACYNVIAVFYLVLTVLFSL